MRKKLIVIPYSSGSGHTEKMTDVFIDEISSIKLIETLALNVENTWEEKDWTLLEQADAIVFASPTYMGSVSGTFKLFMDKTSAFWLDGSGKIKLPQA